MHPMFDFVFLSFVRFKFQVLFINMRHIESIANTILSSLAKNNIDVASARGQAYDVASAMSSEACGVQGRIRTIARMALYTHCNSHVLNLTVAAACRSTSVRNMIVTLNETFLFFHS